MNQQALASAAAAAQACEATTGVPALLTMAQWALESGWGAHAPGNNCFGIKAYAGCQGVQELATTEVIASKREVLPQAFATFGTLADCFAKHATLLAHGGPYACAWERFEKTHDAEQLAKDIAHAYSTSPGYAATLLELMRDPRLKNAVAPLPG